MIASFMQGIEHGLDNNHLSSLADRLPGWSGSDIQVCLPERDEIGFKLGYPLFVCVDLFAFYLFWR